MGILLNIVKDWPWPIQFILFIVSIAILANLMRKVMLYGTVLVRGWPAIRRCDCDDCEDITAEMKG